MFIKKHKLEAESEFGDYRQLYTNANNEPGCKQTHIFF